MTPLLETFLTEARELVQQATDALLALEREAGGAAATQRLEDAFRAFHTLKGSAALFAFGPMTAALHAAEDLFAAAREGNIDDEARVVDVALDCLDQVARWLDAIEAEGGILPAEAEAEGAALEAALRQALASMPAHRMGAVGAAAPTPAEAPNWIASLTEAERVALRAARQDRAAPVLAVSYDPDPGCFMRGDDPLGLVSRVPGLVLLRVEPREPWPDPSGMDPFLCNLRIRAIAFGAREEVEAPFRVAGGQAHIQDVPPAALGLDAPEGNGEPAALVVAVLEEQILLLHDPGRAEERAGRVGSALRAAANALRHVGEIAEAARLEAAEARRDAFEAAAAIEAARAALAIGLATPRPAPRPVPETVPAPERFASSARSLRVDAVRVDRLVGLADEMVLAKNGLLEFMRRTEAELGGTHRDVAQALRTHCATIERLTREWYDAATRLRLLPVGQVFRRFPRLVRELARGLGKKAELRISGAETEADRDILDGLAEPLLHLLRNSLDHGVEPPDERRRHGKPETAILLLKAFQEADRVVVEITDDGRGMDLSELRRRATERGLIEPVRAAALSDAEALELVFAPGFSTAESVSDLSGRGMGMNVVRRTVEALGGTVTLRSSPGQGTSVRLGLPLSLTLTRILTVAVDRHVFGLPLRAVARTLRVPREHIRRLGDGGDAALALEDRLVPLIPLRHLLDLSVPPGLPEANVEREARVVLIETEGQEAGLEVDQLGDRLDVVLRPLSGILAGTPGYLGTTLLGSGQVLLVLDPEELVR